MDTFSYSIRRSTRAKRVRIIVYCDGKVEVVGPVGVRQTILDAFVNKKSRWVTDKLCFFENINHHLRQTFSRDDYLQNKDRALTLAKERIRYFNDFYQFSYNKVYIKNQKTRWGSCSNKRNINLNYKILFLPDRLRDYIIVHELCHLKELNHGKNFWSLVQKTFPDYITLKKELYRYNLLLK